VPHGDRNIAGTIGALVLHFRAVLKRFSLLASGPRTVGRLLPFRVGGGPHLSKRGVAAGADLRVAVGADVGEDLPAAGALAAPGEARDDGDARDVLEGEGAGRRGAGGEG
jgi:hypothetical protein